jgi:hypothetical protein
VSLQFDCERILHNDDAKLRKIYIRGSQYQVYLCDLFLKEKFV